MKSAYEIAMARLEKESGPTKKLTDEQKAQVAEIERRYAAKLAEQKLAFEPQIESAESPEQRSELQARLAEETAALEAERDKAKTSVWDGA